MRRPSKGLLGSRRGRDLAAAGDRRPAGVVRRRERLVRPDISGMLRLRFLTTTDFPPFNFIDQADRLSGFHVDLARALCEELAMQTRCQIQALPYEQLADALDAGQGEAVLAGVAVTTELRERFRFTRPYLLLPARFLVNRQKRLTRAAMPGPCSGDRSAWSKTPPMRR